MGGYYPDGVTGCEEQIIGTGLEECCDVCAKELDESPPQDGVVLINNQNLCYDHAAAWLQKEFDDCGADIDELVTSLLLYHNPVAEVIRLRKTIETYSNTIDRQDAAISRIKEMAEDL